PKEHAVPVWCGIRVLEVWVILLVPSMELKEEGAVAEQSVVERPMFVGAEALDAEELRVPATARLDIANRNERLCANANLAGLGPP
ncbi:MAG: hypothetical protein M3O46_23270, partial [Myxococcota bacterium]|nr:hypothetical protein [Myxococcota bacterium]